MKCPICDRAIADGSPRCPHCGADFVDLMAPPPRATPATPFGTPLPESPRPGPAMRPKSPVDKPVIMSTAPVVGGYRIARTHGIVASECAFGMSLFKDIATGLRDLVGGRSAATEKILREARQSCLDDLRKQALGMGADAVISIDLDVSEFSGQGKSMLFVVATGTAVELDAE